ncbi:S-layer homology domain-containing protein [Paenibacillus sp. PR3]|uniref:S-layer homology domain-containing protein n=1 Tax=Paenibacillus terricola TaxID=2763503 RepID=A0ABR8MMJ1_9BACL|nr:glycosyl hydrolase [Paenibacillus terricola]MBD3917178.1 S-layer homology domain-containing protein [Paenibacillus terricola]
MIKIGWSVNRLNKGKSGSSAILAAMLTASLLVTGTAQAAGLPEADAAKVEQQRVNGGNAKAVNWADAVMTKWEGYGIIKGSVDGSLNPNGKVTRVQLVTIMNRLFGYYVKSDKLFADVPSSAWYANELSIAREAGYYQGYEGNKAQASANVTRQDAVTLLARVFQLASAGGGAKLAFADEAAIRSYARDAIAAMDGVIQGYADGTFRPNGEITRAELMTIIDRLVAGFYYKAGTFVSGEIKGNGLINHTGVTLKEASISGNLYLAPGIADGEATIDKVSVAGKTIVAGGGDHSIHVNSSKLGQLLVDRAEGNVRIVLAGGSSVGEVMFNSAGQLVIENGSSVGAITVSADAEGSSFDIQGLNGEVSITLQGGSIIINGETIAKSGTYSWKDGKLQADGSDNENGGTGNGTGTNGTGGSGGGGGGGTTVSTVDLVDAQASTETKSLFAYLEQTRGQEVLFGHQHDTDVSFAGKDGDGNVISDVKNGVGDYPAVFGWDTLSLDGHENPPGVAGDYEASRLGLTAAMKHAHELGGVVTLSTHPYNFVTGGSFNDTSNTAGATKSVVTRILPGGDKNDGFNDYLDRIAEFANGLKDDNGKLIPVLFRPFHEQNGSWFWWGAATTTKVEYVELYRYTVEYLRDVKHVRNFLYVYSPNGSFNGSENEYLTTYPGDDYVDILGMDQYDSRDGAGSDSFLNGLVKDLKMISQVADRKSKIATLSEYGYSAQGMKVSGNNEKQWFTKVMNAIKNDPDAKRIAYMLTWANFDDERNLFVPYKNVAGKGDHELLEDFVHYYEDPYTAFAGEIRGDNVYGQSPNSAAEQPFLHIVSPTNVGTASEATTVIRVKVNDASPTKVTYSIGAGGEETAMTLDSKGYYAGDWKPSAELNGKSASITVRAYLPNGTKLEQQISVFVKVPELALRTFTFDTPEDAQATVSDFGHWPDSIAMSLDHAVVGNDGKLAIKVASGLSTADTWQELKLKLTDAALNGVNLSQVQRLKLSALIPVTAGGAGASIQAIAMYQDAWDVKYGENATKMTLTDLPKVTVDGVDYYQYNPVIELNIASSAAMAEGLIVSLVGSGLSSSAPISILVDDLGLYNAYTAPVLDTSLVDDFEGYSGSTDALASKYSKVVSGGTFSIALDSSSKSGGDYGMKLQYAFDPNAMGYVGVNRSLGTVDWSSNNALKLWVKTGDAGEFAEEGKPLKLVVQVVMNGTYYEAYPTLAASSEYPLVIPFGDFKVAPWSSGGPVTKEALQSVTNFNLYVNAMDNDSHSGELYVDEIRAVHQDGLPEPGDHNEQPGTPAGALYHFRSDDDLAGWKLENNNANASSIGYDAGEGALSVDFPLGNGGMPSSAQAFELVTYPSGLDLSKLDTMTANVKLSQGTAKARLFLKSGSGWTWVDSGTPVAIDSNGYTALTISLKDAAGIAGVKLSDIKLIGIKLEEVGDDAGTAKLLLKDVALAAALPEVSFGFDSDMQGWTGNAAGNLTVTHDVYSNSGQDYGVLKTAVTWPEGSPYLAISKAGSLDLSSFKGLTAKVKIDSAVVGVQAKLFIQLRNWVVWIDSGALSADGDGFATLTIDFSNMSPYVPDGAQPFTADDLKSVNAIGIQIVTPGGEAGTANVYVDEVKAYR